MATVDAMYSPRAQILNQGIALGLIVLFVALLKINVGPPPTIIVGGSAIVGFFCWRATNLRRAISPAKTAIVFLLTVAALHVHMFEEHARLFGPAMSRLFNIAFPDERFLLIFVFVLPVLYYLTAIGLLLRVPLAAFVARFIFIGPDRGIHALHLPADHPRARARQHLSDRRDDQRRAHRRHGKPLYRHDRKVLLSGHDHGRPADDSGNLQRLVALSEPQCLKAGAGGDSSECTAQDTFSGRNHREDPVTNPELVGIAALLLRLSLAVMFYAHAWVKIKVFTPAGTVKYFESLGVPGWFAYATMAAEIGGATLLLLGIETRWVALLLVPLMLGTIVLVHGKAGWMFTNKDGGWEYPAFWTVGLLVLALLGDGSAALGPMMGL